MTDIDKKILDAFLPAREVDIGSGVTLRMVQPSALEVFEVTSAVYKEGRKAIADSGDDEDLSILATIETGERKFVELGRLVLKDDPKLPDMSDRTLVLLAQNCKEYFSALKALTGIKDMADTEEDAAEAPFASDEPTD